VVSKPVEPSAGAPHLHAVRQVRDDAARDPQPHPEPHADAGRPDPAPHHPPADTRSAVWDAPTVDSPTHDRLLHAWQVLATVPDPEVPAVSVVDLGLVRGLHIAEDDRLQVTLTPTYSGCPATEVIEASVREALLAAHLGPVQTLLRRDPAWTTDWITPEGRDKLRAYGIVPPGPVQRPADLNDPSLSMEARTAQEAVVRFMPRRPVALACPRCGSTHTEQLSAFGATACKALWRCLACAEPFEHFKPI
jgi:ring-1,2-phenylacetyl-CoA epoxidase subunit PaaD